MRTYLSATEAAELLGISRETLYAYVSRGQLRSESIPGPSRQRGYRSEDVLEVKRRKEARRDPSRAVEQSLKFGPPILPSSITLIQNERLYYRGQDALKLAETQTLEEIAALLWGAGEQSRSPRAARAVAAGQNRLKPGTSLALERMQLEVIQDSLRYPNSYDLRSSSVHRTGWRVLSLFERLVSGRRCGMALHLSLQRAWAPRNRSAADIMRSALVLCADHELNVSAFAVRCAASAGASPHDCLLTGLATLKGRKHGGQTAAAANLLLGFKSAGEAKTILAERLRQGESVPGFGHPLYPSGDCRAFFLLDCLYRSNNNQRIRLVRCITEAAEDLLGERPNLDWALAALGHALALPKGAPLFMFAAGRTVGWLAHAIEQYESGTMIRPRAKYTGPVPIMSVAKLARW
jgi:citrate synthase